MKKQIISLAIAAIALTSFTSFAQATTDATQTEKMVKKGRQGKGQEAKNPFEGLNLTADQQKKLDALAAERKAARENEKKASRETREKAKATAKANRRAERKAELDKIKAILSPEQYVTYLENLVLDGRGGKHAAHKKVHRDGKKDRKGSKGQKGSKGTRPDKANPSLSK